MTTVDTFEDELREDRVRTNAVLWVLVRRLLSYVKPYWRRVVVGTTLVLFSAFLSILPPLLIGAVVDVVFGGEHSVLVSAVTRFIDALVPGQTALFLALSNAAKLSVFALLFVVVRVLTFAVDWGNGYLLTTLGQSVLFDIRMHVFRHIHTLSLSFFHRNPVGRLVTRTTNDVGALEEALSVALVTILKDIAMLVGIAVLLLLIDLRLGLVALSVTPIMVLATVLFRRYSQSAYRKWRAALSRLTAFTAETLSGIRVVQLFRSERRSLAKYTAIAEDYRHQFMRQRLGWAVFRPTSSVLSAIGIALVIWMGGTLVLQSQTAALPSQRLTVGVLISVLAYVELFFVPIRDLTEKIDALQSAVTAAERIFTVLDVQPDFRFQTERVFPPIEGSIEFKHVDFSYKTNEPVLHDLSFSISKGQTVALVGHTGAGKTTIINLVSRFYDTNAGQVLVDGRDVREYSKAQLRRAVATVHQDVFLFAGTIMDNIRLGEQSITAAHVESACKTVGASEFIEKLPGGYNALVSEGGKTFSAGERQLLSFARALVFDPAILILDEATASIDTHAETRIQRALVELTKNRTSIIIAHRLSTIQRADAIFVLHKGTLLEAGTHAELLSHRGTYYRLCELHFGKAIGGGV